MSKRVNAKNYKSTPYAMIRFMVNSNAHKETIQKKVFAAFPDRDQKKLRAEFHSLFYRMQKAKNSAGDKHSTPEKTSVPVASPVEECASQIEERSTVVDLSDSPTMQWLKAGAERFNLTPAPAAV